MIPYCIELIFVEGGSTLRTIHHHVSANLYDKCSVSFFLFLFACFGINDLF